MNRHAVGPHPVWVVRLRLPLALCPPVSRMRRIRRGVAVDTGAEDVRPHPAPVTTSLQLRQRTVRLPGRRGSTGGAHSESSRGVHGPGRRRQFVAMWLAVALAAALLIYVPDHQASTPALAPVSGGLAQTARRLPVALGVLALHWLFPGRPGPGVGGGSRLSAASSTAATLQAFPPDAADPPNARPPEPTVPPPDVYGTNPVVGVYHTGTTEAYAPALVALGKPPARYSLDQAVTVVQVGAVLCQSLLRLGVGCVHSRAINDPDGVLGAYENSAKTARAMLGAYPTLRILLDLHRMDVASPASRATQGAAAPVTLVVGTDDLLPEPHWRQNLAFARVLEAAARRLYPTWPVHVEVSPNQYNQELLPGALLVEVGDVDTPLAQADAAARRLAQVLEAVIRAGLAPPAGGHGGGGA